MEKSGKKEKKRKRKRFCRNLKRGNKNEGIGKNRKIKGNFN